MVAEETFPIIVSATILKKKNYCGLT